MYVEFIGLPGAGKTTLAAKVKDFLEGKGYACVTRETFFSPRRKKFFKFFWSLGHLFHLDFEGAKLLLSFKHQKQSWRKIVTKAHEYLKLRHQISHLAKTDIALWDNGLVQWFSNPVITGLKSDDFIADFIERKLPRKTLFFFLDLPAEEAVARVRAREDGLIAAVHQVKKTAVKINPKNILEDFGRIREAIKGVAERLVEKNFSIIVLDGTRSREESVQVVWEKIQGGMMP